MKLGKILTSMRFKREIQSRRSRAKLLRTVRRSVECLEQRQLLAADLEFSTFFPSTALEDAAYTVNQDSAGNAYVSSYAFDNDGAYESAISKLSPTGELLWSKKFDEYILATAVDDAGFVYFATVTLQDNLPVTSDAYQSQRAGDLDLFVAILDGNAMDPDTSTLSESELVYASYLGGTQADYGWDVNIATDGNGGLYVASSTRSADFPTTDQPDVKSTLDGNVDGVVSYFAPDGNGSYMLAMSTYLGGNGDDDITDIAVDSAGTIHLGGRTDSSDLATTPNSLQTEKVSGFLYRINSEAEVQYSTYFAEVWHIAVDDDGSTYLTGATGQKDGFPVTPDAYAPPEVFSGDLPLAGNFITKIDADGGLEHSTWFQLRPDGSAGFHKTPQIALDGDRVVFAGQTDVIRLLRFDSSLSGILDEVEIDPIQTRYWFEISNVVDGQVFVAGATGSSEFETTPGALHSTKNAGVDGVVRKYSFGELLPPTITRQNYTLDQSISAGSAFAVIQGRSSSEEHTLSYSITGGNVGNAFAIDAATGKLTIEDPSVLDFVNYEPVNLTITVTDDQSPPQSNSAVMMIQPFERKVAEDLFEFRDFESGEGWIEPQWQTTNYTYMVDGYANYGGVLMQDDQGLLQRSFDSSDVDGVRLSFWTKLESLERNDEALVQVSSDGVNWQTVKTFVDGDDDNTWRLQEIDFATPGDRTYIRFDAEMSRSGSWWRPNYDWWYVDEIVVSGIEQANQSPLGTADRYTIDEGQTLSVSGEGVLANDVDPDGDSITAVLSSEPVNGSLSFNSNGTFIYSPNEDFSGNDSFTYQVSDGLLLSDAITVSIEVIALPDNDPPTANDDNGTTYEDTSVTIDVLANDSDPEDDALTIESLTQPASGTASIVNGQIEYSPAANFNGSDSFTYTIVDPSGNSATATVDVTITPVNDDPTAGDDSVTTTEDTPVTFDVLANDSDVDGDSLSIDSATDGSNGTVTINANGNLTYTPASGFFGSDQFTYTISDGNGGSDTANVMVTVEEQNDPPLAVDDTGSTAEDMVLLIDVLANDSDPDGDTLSIQSVSDPASGTAAIAGGQIEYTPGANFNGNDSFTYTIVDTAGQPATATVNVTVTPVNDAPVATGDSYSLDQDSTLTIDAPGVLANDSDVDGDTLTATVVSAPATGSLTLNADGSFAYTPDAGFVGTDSFTYQAVDTSGAVSEPVTVSLQVNAIVTGPKLSHGELFSVTNSWQTVSLDHSYNSAVIVATPRYNPGSGPGVVRISNVTATSFDVRVDNPGSSPFSGGVHFIAMEEGVYDVPGAYKLEAVKFDATTTSRRGGWQIGSQGYQQSYSNPVVVGQVMSTNDEDWSVFWSSSSSRTSPANSGSLNVGKHVGEDTDRTRATETLGYFVIESTSGGTIGGLPFTAGVGSDTIRGVDNGTYQYSNVTPAGASTAVLSSAGMDGADGGWAALMGSNPVPASGGNIDLSIDEDQIRDSERKHTTEQVAYFVIGGPVGEGEASPRAIPQVTVHDPLDVNGDGYTSPIDALQVINWLNTSSLTAENGIMEEGDSALDTNGDGRVSPIDALVVINRLNARSLASANQASSTQAIDAYFGDLMDDEEDAIFGLQL